MDDIDRAIIAQLQADARASYRHVGEAVGLSASAVKRRVDRLTQDGTIRGFTVQVDPGRLGWGTEVFVSIFASGNISPGRIRQALTGIPEVVAAFTVTGDADALVQVRVRDTAHLEVVLEAIRREPFVAQTRSLVVLSRLVDRPDPLAAVSSAATPTDAQ
jgi:DNA-binding Lrp family transcriptional regulator